MLGIYFVRSKINSLAMRSSREPADRLNNDNSFERNFVPSGGVQIALENLGYYFLRLLHGWRQEMGLGQIKMPHKAQFFNQNLIFFSGINASRVSSSLWLVSKVLEKLVLTKFAILRRLLNFY